MAEVAPHHDTPSPVSEEATKALYRHYLEEGWLYLIPNMSASVSYHARTGDPSSKKKHFHKIHFKDDFFTLDGKGEIRNITDPANKSFLESLKEEKCPDEFNKEDGIHLICAFRAADMDWPSPDREKEPKIYDIPSDLMEDKGELEKNESEDYE